MMSVNIEKNKTVILRQPLPGKPTNNARTGIIKFFYALPKIIEKVTKINKRANISYKFIVNGLIRN